MRRQLLPALRLLLVFTVLTGIAYPLVVLGFGQLLFKDKADGSMVQANGQAVGSSLLGQTFTSDKYFWGRPSAAGNAASGTSTDGQPADVNDPTLWSSGGSNLGPTNPVLIDGDPSKGTDGVAARVAAYRKANGMADDAMVPVDAVTASGSGLDPHISIDNARLQAPRVGRARNLSTDQVNQLIDAHTDNASLGVFGLPGVNVLQLNVALDQLPH
jgi:K+-transporting ATPase ATPase C chain